MRHLMRLYLPVKNNFLKKMQKNVVIKRAEYQSVDIQEKQQHVKVNVVGHQKKFRKHVKIHAVERTTSLAELQLVVLNQKNA